jgi:hypothetical protein
LQILRKDYPNHFGLSRDDHNLLIHCGIAEGDRTPDPNSLALGGSDLISHPLPDQFALELGKGQQHIERKPAHARTGVERLGDRYKRDTLGIEQLDQLGKISERAG